MNKESCILVTGGVGFVGSHIIDALISTGYKKIIVIDNLMGSDPTKQIYIPESVSFIYGSVTDKDFLDNIFREYQPQYVFHIAANGNVPLSDKYPKMDFDNNALGSFNLINCCIEHKIKKVVYASSAAVYGEPVYTPVDEQHPLEPISYYGVSKLYGERLGMAAFKTYDLPFTAIRIFNTYGPRQPRYVLFDLIRKLSRDKNNLEVLGTGKQIRDYSFATDTANAFLLALENERSCGEVFNIAGGLPVAINTLVDMICNTLNISPKIHYTGASWKGDLNELTADISKIKEYLEFEPKTSLYEGLSASIEWFRENGYIQ